MTRRSTTLFIGPVFPGTAEYWVVCTLQGGKRQHLTYPTKEDAQAARPKLAKSTNAVLVPTKRLFDAIAEACEIDTNG